jgi:hypothetical protein
MQPTNTYVNTYVNKFLGSLTFLLDLNRILRLEDSTNLLCNLVTWVVW